MTLRLLRCTYSSMSLNILRHYSTPVSTMRAIVAQGHGKTGIQTINVPTFKNNDVLVKVKAVTLNPTDWRTSYRAELGAVLGCDFSGIVQDIGSDVTGLKKGDRVAGCKRGGVLGQSRELGAFAEYTVAENGLFWKVPSSVTNEEAAALGGVGIWTALNALFLRLKLPYTYNNEHNKTPVLIWGASTSVGMYSLQLAKASGYTVIGTASPKNHKLVKSLGADVVYDYNDLETPNKIKSQFPNLSHCLDCISERGTTLSSAKSFSDKGGKLITLLPAEKTPDFPDNVVVELCIVYTMFGKDMSYAGRFFGEAPEERSFLEKWNQEEVQKLIHAGKLQNNPLKIMPGNLESIHEGLCLLEQRKVSAQKLAYQIH